MNQRTRRIQWSLWAGLTLFGAILFLAFLLAQLRLRVFLGKPLPVYGDGQQIRDWLYVEDHCRAVLSVLERGDPGEIYNIGGNCSLANLEVIRRILKATKKPQSLITPVADRPGHDRRYALTNDKLTRQTGWKPQIDFGRGLTSTIDWYKTNRNWVKHVKSGEYRQFYELNYANRT